MVGITLITLSITIIFTYLWIGNFHELNLFMLCTCVLLTVSDGSQITVGFGFAGRIHSLSRSLNRNIDWIVRKNCSGRVSWVRKFWSSCPIMKVEFFATNFFDMSTSLNLNKFCVDQTINLVLLW